jgi:hypothetical protein
MQKNTNLDTLPKTVIPTPGDLEEAGHILWGKTGWQSGLAKMLDVTARTVRRWLADPQQYPVCSMSATDLIASLAQNRANELHTIFSAMGGYKGFFAMPVFSSDKDIRSLTKKGWSADFHRSCTHLTGSLLLIDDVDVRLVEIDPADYRIWLSSRDNSPDLLAAYAAEIARKTKRKKKPVQLWERN